MFSRSKDSAPPPGPAAAPAAKRGRPGPSIISNDMAIQGSLRSSGDMQVDGKVEGDIRTAGLVIGEGAEVHGEIFAEDVTVRGKVTGRIRARKVLLAATSHVEGDILHEAFAVESGAFFEGNIRHSDNVLDDGIAAAPDVPFQAPQPAPATEAANLFAPLSRVAT